MTQPYETGKEPIDHELLGPLGSFIPDHDPLNPPTTGDQTDTDLSQREAASSPAEADALQAPDLAEAANTVSPHLPLDLYGVEKPRLIADQLRTVSKQLHATNLGEYWLNRLLAEFERPAFTWSEENPDYTVSVSEEDPTPTDYVDGFGSSIPTLEKQIENWDYRSDSYQIPLNSLRHSSPDKQYPPKLESKHIPQTHMEESSPSMIQDNAQNRMPGGVTDAVSKYNFPLNLDPGMSSKAELLANRKPFSEIQRTTYGSDHTPYSLELRLDTSPRHTMRSEETDSGKRYVSEFPHFEVAPTPHEATPDYARTFPLLRIGQDGEVTIERIPETLLNREQPDSILPGLKSKWITEKKLHSYEIPADPDESSINPASTRLPGFIKDGSVVRELGTKAHELGLYRIELWRAELPAGDAVAPSEE